MNKRKIGADYEQVAAKYLQEKGYFLLQKNYFTRYSEIDLIAKDREILVFCEIKYRRNDTFQSPLEAVDSRKQKRVCRAALIYLCENGYPEDTACRFDVIAIQDGQKILHLENAFDYQ